MESSTSDDFCQLSDFNDQGGFVYGQDDGNLFKDVTAALKDAGRRTCDEAGVGLLGHVVRQPSSLYCSAEDDAVVNIKPSCCLVHIVKKRPFDEWSAACKKLDARLKSQLELDVQNTRCALTVQSALKAIEATGRKYGPPTAEWESGFQWLSHVLPDAFAAASPKAASKMKRTGADPPANPADPPVNPADPPANPADPPMGVHRSMPSTRKASALSHITPLPRFVLHQADTPLFHHILPTTRLSPTMAVLAFIVAAVTLPSLYIALGASLSMTTLSLPIFTSLVASVVGVSTGTGMFSTAHVEVPVFEEYVVHDDQQRPSPSGQDSQPPPGSQPPGSQPPGSQPPGSQPPGSQPPGSQPPGPQPPHIEGEAWVKEVITAANCFTSVDKDGKELRVGQLAAILLNVYNAMTFTKCMIEVKTGEGKTFICAISAAVAVKLNPTGTSMILTASIDRAAADLESTKAFLEAYLGKVPSLMSSWELQEDMSPVEGIVAYGQVSDLQHIDVNALQNGLHQNRYKWLGRSSIFVDEADHVLIEQAESLLFIASPCPSYHALAPHFYQILMRLDFHAEYSSKEVRCNSAVQEKAAKLSEAILEYIRDARAKNGHAPLYPAIVDVESVIAVWSSGALSARMKKNGKQFIVELSSKSDSGTISSVHKITIIDMATGTESNSRWTAEAPTVEGLMEMPIGGSEPLAFFSAFPALLNKARWFGGITGTLGERHCTEFYERTYEASATFKIPRNVQATIYHLPMKIARLKSDWIDNITSSVDSVLNNTHDLGVRGPVLVVVEDINKSILLTNALLQKGYSKMKKNADEEGTWAVDGSGDGTKQLYPLYLGKHEVPEHLADNAVVVASNKGGRGLDLQTKGKQSVLFVILTEVLLGRQDEQARGRCGRAGKPGVVQYHLFEKKKDIPSLGDKTVHQLCDVAVFLKRKLRKDTFEIGDLGSKSNRIKQHILDGWVLEKFCDRLPKYVEEWMKKLFTSKLGACDDLTKLKPVFQKWLRSYIIELWAYWRGYGGSLRGPGDILAHFMSRMGLRAVQDLPEPPDCEPADAHTRSPIHDFAKMFWRFVCILRVSAEPLFALVKVILPLNSAHITKFCIDILVRATTSDPSIKLIPWGDAWMPEFTGNAALFLAALSSDPSLGLRRALAAVSNICKLFDDKKLEAPQAVTEAPSYVICPKTGEKTRETQTYYLVQLNEIILQLKYREDIIKSLIDVGAPKKLLLRHISAAFSDPTLEYAAYCLGFNWCKVVFEVYPACSPPFGAQSEKAAAWGAHLKKKALELPQPPPPPEPNAPSSGGFSQFMRGPLGGGGSSEVRSEERDDFTAQGEALSAVLNAYEAEDAAVGGGFQWEATAPTQADISASKQGVCEQAMSWIEFAWEWVVAKTTGPSRFASTIRKGGMNVLKNTLRADVQAELDELLEARRKKKVGALGDTVKNYLGEDMAKFSAKVNSLGLNLYQSEVNQEDCDVRHDGKTKEDISRSKAKAQANEEAAKDMFLQSEDMADEDRKLINDYQEVLHKARVAGKLDGFEDELRRYQQAVQDYNAMQGNVSPETAEEVRAIMKSLWENMLKCALDHGDEFPELKEHINNYKAKKDISKITKCVTYVRTKITEVRKTIVNVAEAAYSTATGWIGCAWGAVKELATAIRPRGS